MLAATGVILVVTTGRGDKPTADPHSKPADDPYGWLTPVVGLGVLGVQGKF